MMHPILSAKQITKVFGQGKDAFTALDNVSISLYPGMVLSLLGVNGAGKTTLSSILASLKPPTSGEILFKDKPLLSALMHYRSTLGYVQQAITLEDALTVREHLVFAGQLYGVDASTIEQRVTELLALFHLEPYAHLAPSKLSGGYRQRVLIARALVHKPEVLLLDEPTSALDPHIRREIWHIVKSLRDSGIAILLTTHNMDEAEALSDQICVLHHGRMLFTTSPQALKEMFAKTHLEDVFVEIVSQHAEQNSPKE